ncbi:thiaminase II [Mycobacterium koreense]|uniref:Aminopyrimidine aminohydrolase n=1 Tax=Mycolicibacillus koreensis TaxID=1069220 RepID=A0A7I7SEX3_9MYCO|nr:thiaminase II [Mycolicibacillus koreensis]MCV7249021.1 thiaminase II [Mycolicibacillus koreensis]OSC34076.1 thiaminase II [Mycolicibacillus koreensis]BBY54535.1 aminopyrimidine aminohydrolase [Mycolicibacillus koreensis]
MADRFRDLLWADITAIYSGICDHPFITGLTDGSLSHDQFRYYITQDDHYLRGYARALAGCAAKADDENDTVLFARHAHEAILAEQDAHAELLAGLGTSAAQAAGEPVSPTTQAYVSYLLSVTVLGSYAEAVAAVLPCYWIYAAVGEHLQKNGSPDPLYQRWIDMYAGDEFAVMVDDVLAVTDRLGDRASTHETELMRRHFRTASRYEWMFWDAAYRQEAWPV